MTLCDTLQSELNAAAEYCSIPPDKLVATFVADGLKLYRDSPDELRDNLNEQVEQPA